RPPGVRQQGGVGGGGPHRGATGAAHDRRVLGPVVVARVAHLGGRRHHHFDRGEDPLERGLGGGGRDLRGSHHHLVRLGPLEPRGLARTAESRVRDAARRGTAPGRTASGVTVTEWPTVMATIMPGATVAVTAAVTLAVARPRAPN